MYFNQLLVHHRFVALGTYRKTKGSHILRIVREIPNILLKECYILWLSYDLATLKKPRPMQALDPLTRTIDPPPPAFPGLYIFCSNFCIIFNVKLNHPQIRKLHSVGNPSFYNHFSVLIWKISMQ